MHVSMLEGRPLASWTGLQHLRKVMIKKKTEIFRTAQGREHAWLKNYCGHSACQSLVLIPAHGLVVNCPCTLEGSTCHSHSPCLMLTFKSDTHSPCLKFTVSDTFIKSDTHLPCLKFTMSDTLTMSDTVTISNTYIHHVWHWGDQEDHGLWDHYV